MKRFVAALALAALSATAASAGQFSLLSMQYSAEKFVPHFRFDGTIAPGDSQAFVALFDRVVSCEESCVGPSAVLALNSFGGDYFEARKLAEALAERHVATVIEYDQTCYSACLVAFIGGTGRDEAGVARPDRIVEPGARLALDIIGNPHEALAADIAARRLAAVLGGTREQLQQAALDGAFGLDSLLVGQTTGAGQKWLVEMANPEGLFLLGAGLPPVPQDVVQPDREIGLYNACAYALAALDGQTPIDMAERISDHFSYDLEPGYQPMVSGYRALPDETFSFCTTTPGEGALDVVRLEGAAQDGRYEMIELPIENHLLLDPWADLAPLRAEIEPYLHVSHFRSSEIPALSGLTQTPSLKVTYEDPWRRVSEAGDMLVFEENGGWDFEELFFNYFRSDRFAPGETSGPNRGRLRLYEYADNGHVVLAALAQDGSNGAIRIETGKTLGELTEADIAAIWDIQCAIGTARCGELDIPGLGSMPSADDL